MKYILTLLFLLLFCCDLPAQENYRYGFLISLEGDTINILIDDQGDANNALQIKVKSLPDPPEVKYYYADRIAGYHILPGKKYVSVLLNDRFVFLRALVTGKLDLLVFTESNQKENVYIRQGSTMKLVCSLEKQKMADRLLNRHELLLLKKSVNIILDSVFRDCKRVRDYIPYAEFNLNSIARMVQAYNKYCGKLDFVDPVLYSNQPVVSINLYTGLLFSKVEFKEAGKAYFDQSEFQNRLGLKSGVSFDLHYRSWNPGLSLQLDIGFQQKGMHTRKGNTYTKVTGFPPVPLDIKYRLDYIDLGIKLKYRWTEHKLSPYLAGGLLTGYLVHTFNYAYYASENGERADYIFNETNEAPGEAGFHLQFGLEYRIQPGKQLYAGMIYENTAQSGLSKTAFTNKSGGVVVGVCF